MVSGMLPCIAPGDIYWREGMVLRKKHRSVDELASFAHIQWSSRVASLQGGAGPSRLSAGGLLETILQAFLLFIIVTSLIGRFEIHQTSMEPNFHEGQRVIVSQLDRALPDWVVRTTHAANGSGDRTLGLKRGQIIVFYDTPQGEIPLIKRLIAIPGDTVAIYDGQVFVNGEAIDEPYLHEVSTACRVYCGPLTLGNDEYFFMGDNRPGSRDSRSFGPIPARQIVGRVIVRYWPPDQFTLY